MPLSARPANNANWVTWGTDVHAIVSNLSIEPIARYLPANYVSGTTDIAPYVQAAADAIAAEARGYLQMPPGTHYWNSPVYLTSPSQDLSYGLFGHGKGTYVNFGTGLEGKFALYVNQDSAGNLVVASPGFPRIHFADMTLDGPSSTTTMGVICSNMANVKVERLKCMDLYRLVQASDYCDLMEFRKIRWQVSVPGSAMYYNHNNGDGLIIEQITSNVDAVVADLDGCNGATISSIIGGRFIFSNCDAITIISPHLDMKSPGSYATQPFILMNDSRVQVRGGWDHISPSAAMFEVNDTTLARGSELLLDGYTFGFRQHDAAKIRSPHLKVTAAVDSTRVKFRNCQGRILPTGSTNRYCVGPSMASNVTAIQTAMNAYPTAPLENVDLVKTDVGWEFIAPPPVFGRRVVRINTTPTLAAASTTIDPGSFTAGTYFYKVATYTDKGRDFHTVSSTESSVAVTGTQAVRLQITAGVTPALVRVWRGTAASTYDRYVDVPLDAYTTYINDSGPSISGFAWITTVVPTPPTTNTTVDAQVIGSTYRAL